MSDTLLRPQRARLEVLVQRIDAWEDKEGVESVEAAEELILDIKQCLESVLRDYERP